MAFSSIMANGLAAIQRGLERSDMASGQIAARGVEDQDTVRNLVNLRLDESAVKAAANVVKTGDEMLGSIIDIQA